MGRFHRHADGTAHDHDHDDDGHHHHRDVGDHSGYHDTGTERIEVLEHILAENDRVADRNRHDLAAHHVRAVNLMSAPGAGKTTLLRRTIAKLGERVRVGVLEGDIATSLDADALSGLGAQVSLVNTSSGFGGECHLDATMVRSGLGRLELDRLDLLVIENVGNLVCPAEFDVGESARAMVYAVTEGEEKPLKYPVMFRAADVVVVNKVDLLPYLDFDLDAFLRNLGAVNPCVEVIQASARTGEGVDAWCAWLLGTAERNPTMTDTHDHDDAHVHEHSHGDITHTHSHTKHDHEHTEHTHPHGAEDRTGASHDHPHVHQKGLEDRHDHH
jgi:hydrogenase nickel incorporation protein HypB